MPIKTRQFVDLDLNFLPNPVTGDISMNVGNLAVLRAVEYLVQTNHYERKFHPEIGGNITKMLFEPLSDITGQSIQKELTNVINNFEQRAIIDQLIVSPNFTNDGYDISISIYVNNSVSPVTINTFLERLN
jgi:phage baseplate assembly protein W